ncbi:hypothetical protein [Fluviicola taffensis]|uniref:Uncharacterized protein n=1 Tax=Fluviicola taffensis (strain DSM 16823 / NCIMB 13979 / RW262) TaxID=755732 RepID=F2IAS4_FLUTR|nr:hypothetical protein [Fluviicola taffensis]AEA44229.1 hypothetical protein Fluta_2243 [Fluviicola taffensis DSM 16823]
MKGHFIVNKNTAVYVADRSEKELLSQGIEWHNPTINDKTILCANKDLKNFPFKTIDHGAFPYKLVLLKLLQETLFGDSNIEYADVSEEERDYVWSNQFSLSYIEHFKLKRYKVIQAIKSATSFDNNGVTYYLNRKQDVIYLLQALQYCCKEYIEEERKFKIVFPEDFIENYKHCEVINLKGSLS